MRAVSKVYTTVAVALTGVTMAHADTPEGCFTREYSADHLAAQPDQVVARMSLGLYNFDRKSGDPWAAMGVWSANQGHAARDGVGGKFMDQALDCFVDGGAWVCNIECDGGWFTITRYDGKMIEITTESLVVGAHEGCGGAMNIAEVQFQPVTYRLFRDEPAACVIN